MINSLNRAPISLDFGIWNTGKCFLKDGDKMPNYRELFSNPNPVLWFYLAETSSMFEEGYISRQISEKIGVRYIHDQLHAQKIQKIRKKFPKLWIVKQEKSIFGKNSSKTIPRSSEFSYVIFSMGLFGREGLISDA